MAKVLISGYYGFKNFGDELILSVLTEHLKTLEVETTVLSSDVKYTEDCYNVRAVERFNIRKVINEIRNCDILVSGGGSLLQDVTSLKSLVYYSFIIAFALFFNKKVIIFAQGIGPIKNKFAQKIVESLLKLCSYVSVRDEKSLDLLKEWGIDADLVCDPVYSLTVTPKFMEGNVGVQLRDFTTMNYNLLQKLALLISAKFSDKNIKIFSLQKDKDYEICEKFNEILKNINPNIKTEIVDDDIVNKISELEYLIGMRYHALLVAIKYGVKTCAINYDIKVENLAKTAQIPMISMDAHENFEEIYLSLQNSNPEKLLEYANSQRFDWSFFDKLFVGRRLK